jgi:dephospho-CoA kinase
LCELEKLFPESVVDGVANKRYLRNIVFNDKNKLKDLEFIIYPFLVNKIKKMINANSKRNHKVFLDAALLFEKGWDKYCDFVILADVDYEIQKKRVMKRDNVTADDFDKINNVQLKNEDKKLLSDVVINTDKKINKLKVELIKIIENLE